MFKRHVKFFKIVFGIFIATYILIVFLKIIQRNINQSSLLDFYDKKKVPTNLEITEKFTEKEMEKMSALGRWLISSDVNPPQNSNKKNKPYLILIWKYGPFLENRHLKRFTTEKHSPWENCSVQCLLSYNSNDIERADAVIFHIHRIKNRNELPVRRNYNQRWIFLTDESPLHTFLHRPQELSNYNKLFNWSMTYHMDSDIPVPYGRTVKLSTPFKDQSLLHKKLEKKKKLLGIMFSNCASLNNRMNYVRELKKVLGNNLDIIGKCLNGNRTACPSHFRKNCDLLENYKFYLSFENSNCRQYLTEKVFWNAYEKFAIPVIMGAPYDDCEKLLPPNSFIHVNQFSSPLALANYLMNLNEHGSYGKYHKWRTEYQVINEHGYFGSASKHYCRACEALHYNSMNRKVYDNIEHFWSKTKDCNIYH
ncbi:alpha-(1,3)-fucosyltransferase 7-like [Leptopilina heterotoma]|uniref:alpha-(1,3)-fucosyltransferase 7-like n=1 Tax=Leptopilina heterotoma TaxID=63436 RepID=UPI001CA90C5E|nr:alpha-(1,3)-fucosyltransferase 7-like [Leptopilina heterotoma]